MGLSRKLGGGGASSSRDVAPSGVDYAWSTQAYTMQEILTRFRLPCVVQCAGDAGTVLWSHFRFDMRQPLLLHAARTVRKVHARSLKAAGSQYCQLEEFGPPLAIPEDYDGWFFPVGRKDPTVLPRHTRVEGVAASPCRRFLVTTSLPALTPAKGVGSGGFSSFSSGAKHVKHEVSIGEVLTKVDVVKGDTLKCTDENKHEVILPFNHRALLYDVADNYGASAANTKTTAAAAAAAPKPQPSAASGVVHTRTIVHAGNKALPRVFRHVLGELPALSHAFTGIVRCYTVFTEETVMAATMSRASRASQSSSCLELATDSSAKFNIALNASDLKRTKQYCLALKMCEEQAPSYVRAIKASFTVQPVFCGGSIGTDDGFSLALYQNIEAGRGREVEAQGKSSPRTQVPSSKEASQEESPLAPASKKPAAIADVTDFHSKNSSSSSSNYRAQTVLAGDADRGLEVTEEFKDYTRDDDESVLTTSDDNTLDDEAESVLTDDVDADTASQSDATDVASEVEATSEFHIAWGQMKRARTYSGSISSLTDSGSSSSSSTHSDDDDNCAQDHDADHCIDSNHSSLNSSFRSHGSTVTRRTDSSAGTPAANSETNSSKGTTSSNSSAPSVDTVVLRASAPSPIYANLPKKGEGLSVFQHPDENEQRGYAADSVRTRGTNSSAGITAANAGTIPSNSRSPSVETAVLRASAPSPVYANVPKKGDGLSVFQHPDEEEQRSGAADSVRSDSTDARSFPAELGRPEKEQEQLLSPERPFHDLTVRSVWNVTPTIDEQASNLSRCRHVEDLARVLAVDGEGEGEEEAIPLWWGDPESDVTADDADPDLLLDSDEAILQLHNHRRPSAESRDSGSSSSERRHQYDPAGNLRSAVDGVAAFSADVAASQSLQQQQQPSPSARSSVSSQGQVATSHPTLPAASSSSAADGRISSAVTPHRRPSAGGGIRSSLTLAAPSTSHVPLSATSSTHSEGSAQDLAIQRLERALTDATKFLKVGGSAVPAPASAPPDPPSSAFHGVVDDDPNATGLGTSLPNGRPDASSGGGSVVPPSILTRPLPPVPGDQRRRCSSSSITDVPMPAPRQGGKVKAADSRPPKDDGPFSSPDSSTNTPRGSNSRRGSSHELADGNVTSVPLDRNCGVDASGRHRLLSSQDMPRSASTTVFTPSAFRPLPGGRLTRVSRNIGPDRARQGMVSHYQSDSNIYTDPRARRHAASRRQSEPTLDNETGNSRQNPLRYRSDDTLSDSQPASRDLSAQRGHKGSRVYSAGHAEDVAQQAEGQIDMEFVKTLGDRLMAVSRKSTLPKYQRLYHENDHLAGGEQDQQDGGRQFRKKKQRPGSTASSRVTDPGDGNGDAEGSSSQNLETEAKLDDFDLLHEEVV